MTHGVKDTFEISGELQVIDGKPQEQPGVGFRFGRIFHALPPFRPSDTSLDALGGVMTSLAERADGPIPAGYTYFGQFIDHDITKDDTPGLPTDAPDATVNADNVKQARSPSLDLDSVYGGVDGAAADMIDPDGMRLRLGFASAAQGDPEMAGMDVPRRQPSAEAIIGDPRNDENLIVQQLHLAFLKFHNGIATQLSTADPTRPPNSVLAEARDLVTRHYQWIVINDFVRRIVSESVFEQVFGVKTLAGTQAITVNPLIFRVSASQIPPMPLEFSGAAYRLGHSMVRDSYGWNKNFGPGTPFNLFFLFTRLSGEIGQGGQIPLPTFPSNWIADWRRMFDFSDVAGVPPIDRAQVPLNLAKQLDVQIAQALGQLPKGGGNLAARNLVRGSRYGLPSGQDVAAAIRWAGDNSATTLTADELLHGFDDENQARIRAFEFHLKTPLWFYILKEAEMRADAQTLGPVGSRIVAETFLALIRTSRTSILAPSAANPDEHLVFNPSATTVRTAGGEAVTSLPHMLAFAGDLNPLGD